MISNTVSKLVGGMQQTHQRMVDLAGHPIAADGLALLGRLTLAGVFWRSMLTKVETVRLWSYQAVINGHDVTRYHWRLPALPLELKDSAVSLFREEYALPLIAPEIAAWMAMLAEFALPLALILGLFTRFSALALIGMTMVIQLLVYPEAWWSTHSLWVSIALGLVLYGPGRVSVDNALGRLFRATPVAR
jgi:putative oxidoreductase